MGVKGDVILLAGVHEGTESPDKVAKAAKRTFAAGLDLLSLKQSNPTAEQAERFPLLPRLSGETIKYDSRAELVSALYFCRDIRISGLDETTGGGTL
ncbi:MAG: hypothetical protein IKQ90_07905 [Ruminococcus sp.]|nr:hypothetical protein [Ruminococcus sp.]